MARIKVEDVVDHLDSEFRKALEATLQQYFPDQQFESREVFRTFKKMVYMKCNAWENVPDDLVEKNNYR